MLTVLLFTPLLPPKPGEWTHPGVGPVAEEYWGVITCPNCGATGMLGKEFFHVSGEGVVDPSVVCPTTGCDFDSFIHLEGWEDGKGAKWKPQPPFA